MKTAWARAALATVLLFFSAGAQAAGKRVGVPKFEGAQEAGVRKKVMQALKAHGYELVRSRELQEAMSRSGAGADSADGLKALAKELALSAIVTGEVTAKRAKLVVHDGSDGAVLGDASFSGANPRKLAKAVGQTFWKKLGRDVARGHVPAGAKKPGKSSGAVSPEDDEGTEKAEGEGEAGGNEEGEGGPQKSEGRTSGSAAGGPGAAHPEKQEQQEQKEEEAGSTASVPSGYAWLDFELGAGGLNRRLTFAQNFTPSLLSYQLGVGPIAVANLVLYPLAPIVGGVLGNVGLEGELQQGFATTSTLSSGGTSTSFTNVTHDYAGGVRVRIPFGGVNDVYVSGTYGQDTYAFTGRSATNVLDSPDTIYRYVRPGLGLHLTIVGRFSVALAAGYRAVINHGGAQFQQFFPRSTVAGADAEVEARYALSHTFQLRAGLEWRRYWFALNSQPSDTYVANSAVDQSFAFTARIAILLGGRSVPPAQSAAPETSAPASSEP